MKNNFCYQLESNIRNAYTPMKLYVITLIETGHLKLSR